MTRPVSIATEAKVGAHGTEPGYLLEFLFPSGIVRLSSRETESWNGGIWVATKATIANLDSEGGSIEIFDASATLRTLVLQDGINDVRAKVWKFYKGATAPEDPAQVFDGVGDGAKFAGGKVTIGLSRSSSRTLVSPRHRIGVATGFNHLAPEGTLIKWAGRTIRLERRRV
jgi:hypothetical protein